MVLTLAYTPFEGYKKFIDLKFKTKYTSPEKLAQQ